LDIILGIIFFLFLGYLILLIFYLWVWSKIPTVYVDKSRKAQSISVVVPVRNEANGIIECVDSILNQDYTGVFNVIVVDDHSTDGTQEIVKQQYKSVPMVRLILLSEHPIIRRGKKAALSRGIVEASGEIIVTTDGDCVFSPAWLTTLINCFNKDVQIVTGPVVYPEGSKMLAGFQTLDLLSLILATAAGIHSRTYFLGNGANLAFRKRAFEAVDGYTGNETYVSGDDLFLIQKIVARYGEGSIGYAKSCDAAVITDPSKTWRAFLSQRMRWASKNSGLSGRRIFYLWMFLWIVNAAVLAILTLGLLGYVSLLQVALALYFKMMIEGIALYRISDYFNMKRAMRWFPWAFFLNILYVVGIGLMASFAPSFEWKGRRESKELRTKS
jgi:cellulose synthase/poly-beta-1,6-N-acetylglucosamine synthase-like glycosyltransferase